MYPAGHRGIVTQRITQIRGEIRRLTMRVSDLPQATDLRRRWSPMASSALRSVREYGPVWGLIAAILVTAAIILVWGVDWSGPDTTPPTPQLSSSSGTVSWDGGECFHLEHWTGSHWDRIAYSTFDDASEGVWGPPRGGEQFCQPVGVSGNLSLPVDAAPGNYRVCNIGDGTDCLEFAFDSGD